jgi:small GTP-binding protein
MKAKMALVGDSGVGKTSLIRRFVLNEFSDAYINTLGTKVSKIELVIAYGEDVEVRMDLSVFDIVGQLGFGDLVKECFFHGCQGLMAVCDVTRKQTLESLHKWISIATEIAGEMPIIILVNKKDLMGLGSLRQDEVEKVVQMYDVTYAYTSAKTGEFVEDAFNIIAGEIVERAFKHYEARRVDQSLKERLLAFLAKKGRLGVNKTDLFQMFKGVGYDELQRELEELEKEGLIQLLWRGPDDFTAMVTSLGEQAVKTWREMPSSL